MGISMGVPFIQTKYENLHAICAAVVGSVNGILQSVLQISMTGAKAETRKAAWWE